MSEEVPGGFGVLVPVKPIAVAKSRLAPLGDRVRRELVRVLAADTVAAALSSSAVARVLVVTDDHVLAGFLQRLGAEVLPDGASDLNESLVEAAAELSRREPGLGGTVALCADLPSLRPAELTEALGVAGTHDGAFVADAAGSGTTMVSARSLHAFRPGFGIGSRHTHLGLGLHEINEVAVPTLRRDVDTPEDLAVALTLGVGERTAAVAASLRL